MDENQLKQRIVGAIVLVALAVIFIPMLLSGDRDGDMSIVESNIPAKPEHVDRVKTLDIEPPAAPPPAEPVRRRPVDEHTPPAPEPAPSTASEETTAQTESRSDAQVDDSAVDNKAWAVQVGSFSQQSNALGLRDKLRKQGYSTFVEKVSIDNGPVYRVRVGPEVRRSKAEELQQELQAKLKLEGLVVAHP
ncbi:SPOR domain-containing protein [Thiohalophilus sp.]|uniref:SPOR domain-containing protein n=1 Tax=Thiohalophilus sp. TaxID=3028392 RepID=UPI002ACE8725|nr:SPOR domain-containing protein [Thiohalophilus sp.]MDZ7804231.1 SPOR domain-containing protein [Thiohalophilus sp.]